MPEQSSEQPSVEQTPVEEEAPFTKLEGDIPPRTEGQISSNY